MTARDSSRCPCLLHTQPDRLWDESEAVTIDHVKAHGWGVMQVQGIDMDDWAFTVGLWHSFRVPDLAMFGLRLEDMAQWLNIAAAKFRDEGAVQAEAALDGVLQGFPLLVKPVRREWFEPLFGWGRWFYDREAFPLRQLVWPDSNGKFPWSPEAGERCRTAQPQLWLAPLSRPAGQWTEWERRHVLTNQHDHSGIKAWAFPDPADTRVITTLRIIDGATVVEGVVHDGDGDWQFIDREVNADDPSEAKIVCMGCLSSRFPYVLAVGDLPVGWQAWRDESGEWQRSPAEL